MGSRVRARTTPSATLKSPPGQAATMSSHVRWKARTAASVRVSSVRCPGTTRTLLTDSVVTLPTVEARPWAAQPNALPADRPVDQLADEVGMPVVPGVLLDHVHVDPAQRDLLAVPLVARVGQLAARGGRPAARALGLPGREVGRPVGVVERHQLAVLDVRVVPDGRHRLVGERALEPA